MTDYETKSWRVGTEKTERYTHEVVKNFFTWEAKFTTCEMETK